MGARLEGGGPQAELLRRLAHWLMKEPELEEERLSASITDGADRHRAAHDGGSAAARDAHLSVGQDKHGRRSPNPNPASGAARAKADELGLYRLTDGTLNAVAAAGPLNPKEVADMRATDSILAPLARASGGSVHWLVDGGMPDIRRVGAGATRAGDELDRACAPTAPIA